MGPVVPPGGCRSFARVKADVEKSLETSSNKQSCPNACATRPTQQIRRRLKAKYKRNIPPPEGAEYVFMLNR